MEQKMYKVKARIKRANCRSAVITGQYVVPSGVTMDRKEIAADIEGRLQPEFDKHPELRNARIKVVSITQTDMAFCYVGKNP